MHKTIIKIKKSTPPAKVKIINAIIRGLFNNRAGKVQNSSKNPYTLIFKGTEKDWGCIDLGTLALEDVPGLLGYISSCWWIDEAHPEESSDTRIRQYHTYSAPSGDYHSPEGILHVGFWDVEYCPYERLHA